MEDTNTRINQTRIYTTISPQQEDKQIITSNPQNTQDQQNEILRPLCLILIHYINIYLFIHSFIHSFSSLFYDRSKASSKASSPHSAIQSFLLQMRVSSSFLKVIQWLPTSSSLSSCRFYPPLYLSFNNPP
jgi:hypothetical protein